MGYATLTENKWSRQRKRSGSSAYWASFSPSGRPSIRDGWLISERKIAALPKRQRFGESVEFSGPFLKKRSHHSSGVARTKRTLPNCIVFEMFRYTCGIRLAVIRTVECEGVVTQMLRSDQGPRRIWNSKGSIVARSDGNTTRNSTGITHGLTGRRPP